MTGRSASRVRWYRRISVKLAVTLGLAIFSIQFLASILIAEALKARFVDVDIGGRAASKPYLSYLSEDLSRYRTRPPERLVPDAQDRWVPSAEARKVIETFLPPDETFVWLDEQDHPLVWGRALEGDVNTDSVWELCDSPEYCGIEVGASKRRAGSTWLKLARDGRHIGTFVLVWFENPELAAAWSQRQFYADLASRLGAAAVLAALTSVLLVRLVTGRLSRLASEASAPLGGEAEKVDLPGPFKVQGDDEIALLATALNTMRTRIERLVEQLAERDRQRREWVAWVSHDLRTPLTALSACLDRARERLASQRGQNDQSGAYEAIRIACQDGERLHTLVDDLFELARLDAGETLVLEPVPPGELVRQTVRGLRPMAEAKGISLNATVAPSLPTIQADGRRLMRALENLVRNAVQHAHGRVEVSVACVSAEMIFEVRDDGPGLPQVNGQAVLGQTENRPRRPDSAGLGLMVTRRVAEVHGGQLGGANHSDGGARVWIRIPVIQ